ncbi:hypothetical protein [Methylomonas sp. CM2]|uniref:hypothetical protein n=1 Tax=Methylomonas sp. CM2 TaxID=3417647 RepID=UPI003CEAF5AA
MPVVGRTKRFGVEYRWVGVGQKMLDAACGWSLAKGDGFAISEMLESSGAALSVHDSFLLTSVIRESQTFGCLRFLVGENSVERVGGSAVSINPTHR